MLTGSLPPLTSAAALREWQFSPVVSAAVLVLAAGYLASSWRVARRHPARPWPASRTLAFLAGLAVIVVATQSSIGAYDDVLVSVHMVQHVLLIMVAPPLLVLGRPVTLLMHAYGHPVHGWLKRAVRSRAATALTWPPGITAGYCAVVAGTHLTPMMSLAVRYPALHDAEHVLYLVTGYLFFLPVIGSEPIRWRVPAAGRLLMLLAVMPIDTVTGVVLMLAQRGYLPTYPAAGRAWGPAPLADLHDAGIVMWAGGDSIMTALAVAMCVLVIHDPRRAGQLGRWVEGIRRAGLHERIAQAGLAIPPAGSVDDHAHLAAYNATLEALEGDPDRRSG